MTIATQNGWKWNVEQLQKDIDDAVAGAVTQKDIDDAVAGAVTITADVDSGLTAGSIQEVLVALATRVKALEPAA